jgi:hypothetical protein
MGKVIAVIILYVFLSALLRLESKLIVAACRDASVIRGIFDTNSENSEFVSKIPLIDISIPPLLDLDNHTSMKTTLNFFYNFFVPYSN